MAVSSSILPRAGYALGLVGSAVALFALSSGCSSCSREPDRNAPVARAIAERLATTLERAAPDLTCPTAGDIQVGFTCTGRWRGDESLAGEPFEVAVRGLDDSGEPVWKPRGALTFEYQIARGFTAAVRARLRGIRCPDDGDLDAGFPCQLILEDGSATTVQVTASAGTDDQFVWHADGILMLSAIEGEIQRELASSDRRAEIDCGAEVQKSEPGASFACAIRFEDGSTSVATVSVVDAEGHVQYRIVAPSRDDAAPTP